MQVAKKELAGNDSLEVQLKITNSGAYAGKEVVQLYYRDIVASVTPPVKKLVAFQKIDLKPGETKAVRFTLHKSDFSFVAKNLQRITEPGEIELQTVNQKESFYVR